MDTIPRVSFSAGSSARLLRRKVKELKLALLKLFYYHI